MNDIEEFEEAKQRLQDRIEELKKSLEEKENLLENIDNNDKYNERQKGFLKNSILPDEINRLKVQISNDEKQLNFYRPDSKEFEEYKNNVFKTFNKEICEKIPDDLHLLFHGTTIFFAKDIIEDGGIFSPGERNIKSDITAPGNIWVTSKYSAIGLYTTLSYTFLENRDKFTPPGCVFVLKTDEETEVKAGKNLITTSVSFKENPEALFSIITTPENKEMVKGWCEENDIDINKVQDFESFEQMLQDRNNSENKRNDFVEGLKVDVVPSIESIVEKEKDEKQETLSLDAEL